MEGGGGWVRKRGSRDGLDREVREYGWRSGVGIWGSKNGGVG